MQAQPWAIFLHRGVYSSPGWVIAKRESWAEQDSCSVSKETKFRAGRECPSNAGLDSYYLHISLPCDSWLLLTSRHSHPFEHGKLISPRRLRTACILSTHRTMLPSLLPPHAMAQRRLRSPGHRSSKGKTGLTKINLDIMLDFLGQNLLCLLLQINGVGRRRSVTVFLTVVVVSVSLQD